MDLLDSTAGRALAVLALLAVASLLLALARRRDGVFRAVPGGNDGSTGISTGTGTVGADDAAGGTRSAAAVGADRLTADDLGRPLGERATLLQLSAPTCATCPQVSRVLGALARDRAGVVHVEVDAVARPELARRLGVLRTPTVLLLGPRGEIRARASGPVDRPAAAAALELAVGRA